MKFSLLNWYNHRNLHLHWQIRKKNADTLHCTREEAYAVDLLINEETPIKHVF